MGRPKKGATKEGKLQQVQQVQQPSRNELIAKLRAKYSRDLNKLDKVKSEQLTETRDEIELAYKANRERLEDKFNKDLAAINEKYPAKHSSPTGKIRDEMPNIYEMMYLGQNNNYLRHLNPWIKEVCDDEHYGVSAKYMVSLREEFKTVIEPMFRQFHETGIGEITFGRHMSNRPHANGCGYSDDMMDPCREPVGSDYYVEFTILSLQGMSRLLEIMDNAYVYHNTDQAKSKGYMWYVVFTYPNERNHMVLRLYWRPQYDPMYVLGRFLQLVQQNMTFFSERAWQEFLQRYEDEIQYIGGHGFEDYTYYNVFLKYEKALHKKYWVTLYREPRNKPLQMDIKPEY